MSKSPKVHVLDYPTVPGNPRKYLYKRYIARIELLGYIFVADSMGLFSFKFSWWAPKDTVHSLGLKGQRSTLRCNKVCWKQHFLGLLTRYLEKYLLDFHQTYTSDVLWERDGCIKFFWGQQVKVQGHGRKTYAGTVELDFLVVSYFCFRSAG